MNKLGFWEWLLPSKRKTVFVDAPVSELCAKSIEYSASNLAFMACVNLIANAISRCTIRTFENNQEKHGRDYVLWNVEPNANQNASVFWHKLVTRLFTDGEVLVVPTKRTDGLNRGESAWCVADSYTLPDIYPAQMCKYEQVTVGEVTYDKAFRENEVLHLVLNHVNVKPVLDGIYSAYCRMLKAAMTDYNWGMGQHWKVHVDQLASGQDEFSKNFATMIREQVKTFFDTDSSVLPEFDGYTYERVGGSSKDTRDIRQIIDDIYTYTARALGIPPVLVAGNVAGIGEVNTQFLTYCVDPICRQIETEINRKCYSFAQFAAGTRVTCDSSTIMHFDIFGTAAAVEKAVGSGAFTINDVRRAAGQPTIDEDWANQSYMTKNLGPTVTQEEVKENETNVGNQEPDGNGA